MPKAPRGFREGKYQYHEEVDVDIDNLTNLGQGVGRVDGWVLMVPFALPGERVRARVYRNHANYSDADLVEVLEPSPDRVEPRCNLFGLCGGCQYQNLNYEGQLRIKTNHVQELVDRQMGKGYTVEPAIGSPKPFGYRSKLTPHFQKPRAGKDFKIGFLEVGRRNRLVDVEQCPIATNEINEELPKARQNVFDNFKSYKNGATILLRHVQEGVETDFKAIVTEVVDDVVFRFKASEFFQNNPFILPLLAEHVLQEAQGDGVRYLLDTYCGSGLFALYVGRHFEQAVGIEISEKSVEYARDNAALNSLENCSFQVGDAAHLFANITHPADESVVIVDPPRKGCSEEFLEQLFAFGPARVVYVSCDPATHMRDLPKFLEAGYKITKLQPFDLFPQTRHIENVATLEKSV
ncbi:class I SAM-dependent RNA methyltransferase [Opitutia bacterium ISCC 51]|nr:class I SAM-dependent RNA methyltransferase [Opitutae bacterium ISCC 51]QXD27998.1 class I SAM-dependent RNA methyltransferase [Opitutae bacterium ISCC 52]